MLECPINKEHTLTIIDGRDDFITISGNLNGDIEHSCKYTIYTYCDLCHKVYVFKLERVEVK